MSECYKNNECYETNETNETNETKMKKFEPIEYSEIILEKIGNIEKLNRNFNNTYKKLEHKLIYSLCKWKYTDLIEHLYYILRNIY